MIKRVSSAVCTAVSPDNRVSGLSLVYNVSLRQFRYNRCLVVGVGPSSVLIMYTSPAILSKTVCGPVRFGSKPALKWSLFL